MLLIQVIEVQLPGKKAINAAAFWNGLRGQKLKKLWRQAETEICQEVRIKQIRQTEISFQTEITNLLQVVQTKGT